MKKVTKIAIIVGIIIFVIVALIAFFVIRDLKQEEKLNEELNSLADLLDEFPIDYDKVNSKLAQSMTTGDYYKVEKSYKDFSSDIVTSLKKLDDAIDEDTLTNMLSATNIQKDGPDFKETKNYLESSKKSIDEVSAEMDSYFSEEKVLSYIQDKNLTDYYIDIYKKYAIDDSTSDKKEISKTLEQLKDILNKEEAVIDFLIKNKNSWKLEDDTLVFYSKTLSDQYDKLTGELNNI